MTSSRHPTGEEMDNELPKWLKDRQVTVASSFYERCGKPNPIVECKSVQHVDGNETKRIFLIRHAHSEANLDFSVLRLCSDHTVPLSPIGYLQAKECGKFLKEYLQQSGDPKRKQRFWVSPYKRARETANTIVKELETNIEIRESIFLSEQHFGLFEGLDTAKLKIQFPDEFAHFDKASKYGGRFWARMPLGESRFDVCVRVKNVVEDIRRAFKEDLIDDAFVVSHGVTIRAFQMMMMHLKPEWMENEENPSNCSIRLLVDRTDSGYVFNKFQETARKRTRSESTGKEDEPKDKKMKLAAAPTIELDCPPPDPIMTPVVSSDSINRDELLKKAMEKLNSLELEVQTVKNDIKSILYAANESVH